MVSLPTLPPSLEPSDYARGREKYVRKGREGFNRIMNHFFQGNLSDFEIKDTYQKSKLKHL